MPAKLDSRIPETQRRMRRAAELSIHRAGDSHVDVYQQIAPRDTGLMADTAHKEPEQPTNSNASSYSLMVIAPQPYSAYPEFGTINQEAQPAFMPAYESAKRQLFSEAKSLVNIVLAGGSPGQSVISIKRTVSQSPALAAKRIR